MVNQVKITDDCGKNDTICNLFANCSPLAISYARLFKKSLCTTPLLSMLMLGSPEGGPGQFATNPIRINTFAWLARQHPRNTLHNNTYDIYPLTLYGV